MASSLNRAQLIGHLGKDPEMRAFPDGTSVANFSIATSERWKDKQTGEQKDRTEWHNISARAGLADICGKYLRKGDKVFIEGKLTTRKWTDKNGVDRYTTEIIVDSFGGQLVMLGSPNGQRQQGGENPAPQPQAQAQRQAPPAAAQLPMDDDIPF